MPKKCLSFILLTSFLSFNVKAGTLESIGNAMQVLMPVGAAGITWIEKDKEGFWQLGQSQVSNAVITLGLKETVHSHRPNHSGNDSFPSGHASVTFSAAQFLQQRYGSGYGLPAYALAGLTAYSRVQVNEHHWRDVIGGAAIGIASSYFFTDPRSGRLALIPGHKSFLLGYQKTW